MSRSETEILRLAAGLESQSKHPIARGIVREAEGQGLAAMPVSDFRAIPGQETKRVADGHEINIVSPGYLREQGIETESDRMSDLFRQDEHGRVPPG